jgi:hypothetical protein
MAHFKNDVISSDEISIKVESVRILLSEIKVKLNGDERSVKNGPALFTVTDSSKTVEFASTELPDGSADKIKFEIHRFPASQLSDYNSNEVFSEFASPERYSIIIAGTIKEDNTDIPFEYKTEVVSNLNFDFVPPLTIEDSKNLVVKFEFQTDMVFKDKGVVLDPRDSKNKNQIDKQIVNAIKAVKL